MVSRSHAAKHIPVHIPGVLLIQVFLEQRIIRVQAHKITRGTVFLCDLENSFLRHIFNGVLNVSLVLDKLYSGKREGTVWDETECQSI